LCTKYSQRRGEIEERIADFKAEHGRDPTTAEIHVIAKETRTSKLIEISTEAVRAQQRERASADELAQIDWVKAQAYARQENQTAEGTVIKFAKKLTKHLRVSRGWSAVSATVQSIEIRELPPLGTPLQAKGDLTAWIVE
jgi:hypothetical protein